PGQNGWHTAGVVAGVRARPPDPHSAAPAQWIAYRAADTVLEARRTGWWRGGLVQPTSRESGRRSEPGGSPWIAARPHLPLAATTRSRTARGPASRSAPSRNAGSGAGRTQSIS